MAKGSSKLDKADGESDIDVLESEDIQRDKPGEGRGDGIEPVTVDLSEGGDDDEGGDEAPRQTRREKKAARFKDPDSGIPYRELLDQERARTDQLIQHIRTAPTAPAAQATPDKDPNERELESTQAQMEALADRAEALAKAKGLTPDVEKEIYGKLRELRRKETELITDLRWAANEKKRGGAGGNNQPMTEARMDMVAERHALQAEFGDVFSHSRMGTSGARVSGHALAAGRFQYLMAQAGLNPATDIMTPAAKQLRRQAFIDVRREEGLGNSRDVSDGQRRKFSGGGRGQGGGGGGGNSITLTAEDIRLGTAAYGRNPKFKGDKNALMRHLATKKRERMAKK